MYISKETTPKGKLSEFGSKKWVENNFLFVVFQTVLLYVFAFYLRDTQWFSFFIIWASLPFLGLTFFFSSAIAKYSCAFQSFWWFIVLFWQARNEEI